MLEPLDAGGVPARAPLGFPIVRIDLRVEDAGHLASLLRAGAPARAAFVVTLSGSDDALSQLGTRLRTLTTMPIVEVDAPLRVEPERVYLVAASSGLALDGCMLARVDDARESRYRDILESIHDYAILTTDLDGVIDGWNSGARKLFGYSSGEIIGRPAAILFTPEDRAIGAPEQEMRNAREVGRAEDERFHLRRDGSRFYCSGLLVPLVVDGAMQGYIKIARDRTMRKAEAVEHEQQFVRAQADRIALQNASRLKDTFLATLSHELRNPLNLILMQAEILHRSKDVRAQPVLNRATEVIAQTVRLQARLIDDLLDVSRLNMSKLAIERQPLSLTSVVGESVAALRDELSHKDIALDLALADEPLVVLGDPVRIAQIAWNLASNAIKFTPRGGRILIRVWRDADTARLDVEDSGQGIPEEFLPQVFELFSQQESGTARRYTGMGIGLALVRELVDLHDGHVEAFSAGEGKGARFSVWLPLEARETAAIASRETLPFEASEAWPRPSARASGPRLGGLRVLVVDDDVSSAEAMRELLVDEGARVEAACSAGEALALAQRQLFDVLISDIAMPDMDGHALLRALRNDPRFAGVPAIACTGYGSNADAGHGQRSGFDAHLVKPLDIESVVTSIRDVMEGRRRR